EAKLPRFNPERHILLKEAKEIKKNAELGEEMSFPLESHEEFGRIAAQAAKQAIFQRLRESERESILTEWKEKDGQIVSGVVQRFQRGNVYIDLGRAVGVMFANESIPGEHYRNGERLRFLVMAVQEDTRLPGIILSRSHPKFVAKLFEMEVPEVADGAVEIKMITREPGSRTKVAVVSHVDGVDPVGALVGQRGTRVMAVNNELGQEKIDIIEYSEDIEKFIGNSLSPAKTKSVEILDKREARVYVAEDQLSLAIGRGGQNVRLAAKLTGWKIDVRSQSRPEDVQEGGVAAIESDEEVSGENKDKS
ncbi:MAG TPA: transcription termination factor NusA, partial [Candidatus Paceibacterota bacterium]